MSNTIIKIEGKTIEFENPKDLKNNFGIVISKHTQLGNNLSLSKNVKIGVGVKLGDNVTIGEGVSIADECQIGNNTTIGKGCTIETGVQIGNDVTVHEGLTVDLKDTFYIKTLRSNITYCGNGKASIGCQLFKVDFWLKHYGKVADKFDYTKEEIDECLFHMQHIKDNIND